MLRWNAIPCLWCTIMKVVDAVQIHIFSMPCKHCLPHAEIQVCSINTLNPYTAYAIQNCSEMSYVPYMLVGICHRARNVGTIYWLVHSDVSPKLPLQIFVAMICWCLVPVIIHSVLNLTRPRLLLISKNFIYDRYLYCLCIQVTLWYNEVNYRNFTASTTIILLFIKISKIHLKCIKIYLLPKIYRYSLPK